MKLYSLVLTILMMLTMLPGAFAATDATSNELLKDSSTLTSVTSASDTNFIESSNCKDCIKTAITAKGCKQGFANQPSTCQRLFQREAELQNKSKGSDAAE